MNENNTNSITDTELLAAEYVLGQRRGEERQAVQQQLMTDSELRHWVNWWEQRLFSLALHPKPETPRKEVWERIQTRLFSHAKHTNEAAGSRHQAAQGQGNHWGIRWLNAALVGFALMAMTVVTTLYVDSRVSPSREAPTHYASFETGGVISHIIERYANGDIASIAVHPSVTTDEKVLELWALTSSGTPVSLGVLPNQGKNVTSAPTAIRQVTGTLTLAVSVEPPGGSPTGLPTGPVVNTAKLIERTALGSFSF